MKATSDTFESVTRGGYAKVTCGKRAHGRTVVVGLRFRPPRRSASLSFGVVMVSRFRDGYHVWAVKH